MGKTHTVVVKYRSDGIDGLQHGELRFQASRHNVASYGIPEKTGQRRQKGGTVIFYRREFSWDFFVGSKQKKYQFMEMCKNYDFVISAEEVEEEKSPDKEPSKTEAEA